MDYIEEAEMMKEFEEQLNKEESDKLVDEYMRELEQKEKEGKSVQTDKPEKKSNMFKQLGKRIGVELFNTMMQHQVFRDNYKAISGAEFFLREVAKYNANDNGDSEVSSRMINELFKNYERRGNYKKFIVALIDLGLLKNTNACYRVSNGEKRGWCKRYQITEMGLFLINQNSKEYLKKLYYDPEIRRLNQKSICDRAIVQKPYSDDVLNYVWDGIKHISFDWPVAEEITNTLKEKAQLHSRSLLIDFKEKKFRELSYNKSDGRVWNEYVALKEDFRIVSKYKDMERLYTLDIRACHPTFWALYLKEIYDKECIYFNYNTTLHNTNINNTFIPSNIPITPINTNINNTPYCSPKSGQRAYRDLLFLEVNMYNELFTNTLIDPRSVISEATGCPENKVKEYLNMTINGNWRYKRVLRYLMTNFPLLYDIWICSDVKSTGNNISKNYETKLMLNPELFRLAESLNVKLIYEYDGFSLFFDPQDNQSIRKARIIEQFIRGESKKLWNLDIVFKLKDAKTGAELKNDFLPVPAEHEEMSLAA
jgi:hypothetical protein